MSIAIPSPSIVFNHALPKLVKYTMDKTYNIANAAAIEMHLLSESDPVKKGQPRRPFKSLVLNAHGWPAHVYYGPFKDGKPDPDEVENPYYVFSWKYAERLNRWRYSDKSPRVETIYITSCDIISFGDRYDGNLFCGWVAKQTGSYVIGSNEKQRQGTTKKGHIDDYKGSVWRYFPDGTNEPWKP